MTLSNKLYPAAYALWLALLLRVAWKINQEVHEPYMDEIFHVPQAQAYCRGEWTYWDGAITTPPGLYLLPAALAFLQRAVSRLPSRFDICSLDSLRFFNLAILAALPHLYTSLLLAIRRSTLSPPVEKKLRPTAPHEGRDSARWEGIVIALVPAVGWWGWLYYTDLGSVATVLLSMNLSFERRWLASSLLSVISLLFRQTNVIWIAFIAGVAVVRELRTVESTRKKKRKSQLYDPLLRDARFLDLILTPYSILYLSLHHLSTLVPILLAYLPVFAGFLMFVKVNGGIVLGDKSNHVATIHVPQLYYFVAFSAAFLAPHLLETAKIEKTLSSLFGTKRRIVSSLNVLVIMCWTIRHFTIAHPFLLADNRHFAFYLWRRILNVHPFARYILTPAYLFAGRLIYESLTEAKTMRLSSLLLFAVSTVLVLVPTPLIEPRYYLTPFLILRLYCSPLFDASASRKKTSKYRARLVLEAVLYSIVQATCVWLFLAKSFDWDFEVGRDGKGLDGRDERELGKRQRFMW
ncbi:hypothetical protein JCM3766R1_006654 [Sporobolomyces carnicolor]